MSFWQDIPHNQNLNYKKKYIFLTYFFYTDVLLKRKQEILLKIFNIACMYVGKKAFLMFPWKNVLTYTDCMLHYIFNKHLG